MWRTISFAVAAAALLSSGASSFQVALTNKCSEPIELWHVVERGESMEMLGVGKTTTRTLSDNAPSNVFKKGRGAQATLAEISGGRGMVWFDISIIPTGPKSGPELCPNLGACKALTGGVGFNVPMQIVPSKSTGGRCTTLTCLTDGCSDAYQFPKDDGKTHACPGNTNVEVVFCPGGAGGSGDKMTPAPSPTTQAPTPTPTPTPLPSMTPVPTMAPAPTPTLSTIEDRGALETNNNSNNINATNGIAALADAGRLKLDTSKGENNEVASDADLLVSSATTDSPVVVAAGDRTSGGDANAAAVTEVSTQTKTEKSTGAEVYVLSILCGVGMVAAAAIVVVRKKQQQLDSENVKTPRDRTMTATAALMMLTTPKDNVTVL